MQVIHISKESDVIKYLTTRKIPHHVTLTNNTITISTEGTKYILSNKALKPSQLGFITKVKRYAEKLEVEKGKKKMPFSGKDIKYYRFNNLFYGKYYDVMELDVNKAYWTIAKNLGYISESIYKKGLEVEKETRLVALGALATQKRSYIFDGENYEYLDDTVNEVTRSYFFHISKVLDNMMLEAFQGFGHHSIYFYWVDAFFVKRRAEGYVRDFFKDHGLELKEKNIECMTVKNDSSGNKIAYLSEIKRREEERTVFKIKPFLMSSKKKKKNMVLDNFRKAVIEFSK